MPGNIKPGIRRRRKKAEPALLDEFTRLTGCRRKSAVRLPGSTPVREIPVYGKGEAVKLKKRPADRKAEGFSTDKAAASIWIELRSLLNNAHEGSRVMTEPDTPGLSGSCRHPFLFQSIARLPPAD